MPLSSTTLTAPVGVLGGAGFIGRAAVRALIGAGWRVRVITRDANTVVAQRAAATNPKVIEWHHCDYQDAEAISRAIDGCAAVIHLAASASPARAEAQPDLEQRELLTARHIADAINHCAIPRLAVASSGGTVYGQAQMPLIAEDHPLCPLSVHGTVKLAIELLLRERLQHSKTRCTILRIGNAFGPQQNVDRGQGLIGTLLHATRTGQAVTLYGDGSTVRDYIHVDDVARAITACLHHDGEHDVFNIGRGEGRSVRTVLAEIERLSGVSINVNWQASRALDVARNVLDITRARQALQWSPAEDFNVQLARTLRED